MNELASDLDIFAMVAAIGLVISSGITLVVSTRRVFVSLLLTRVYRSSSLVPSKAKLRLGTVLACDERILL